MPRFKIGDRVKAQRALGAPHEAAVVVNTPTYETAKTLDGTSERIEQVEVEFEDGTRVTLIADSPSVEP